MRSPIVYLKALNLMIRHRVIPIIFGPKIISRPDAPRDLTREEYDCIILRSSCPYCGREDLWEGAQGGMCTNVSCHTPSCQARFNVISDFGPRNSMFGEVTYVGKSKEGD